MPDGVDQELLPAGAAAQEQVGDAQVDQQDRGSRDHGCRAVRRRGTLHQAAAPRAAHAVRAADRRDGLRRRVPGHDLPALRPRGVARPHPPAGQHRPRRHEPALALSAPARSWASPTRSVKTSLRNLDRMPLPAIAHWDGDHWLVLYHVTQRARRLADPALGVRRMPRDGVRGDAGPATRRCSTTRRPSKRHRRRRRLAWLWPLVTPHRALLGRRSASPSSSACCRWCCRCSRR